MTSTGDATDVKTVSALPSESVNTDAGRVPAVVVSVISLADRDSDPFETSCRFSVAVETPLASISFCSDSISRITPEVSVAPDTNSTFTVDVTDEPYRAVTVEEPAVVPLVSSVETHPVELVFADAGVSVPIDV